MTLDELLEIARDIAPADIHPQFANEPEVRLARAVLDMLGEIQPCGFEPPCTDQPGVVAILGGDGGRVCRSRCAPPLRRAGRDGSAALVVEFLDQRLPDRFWDKCIPEPNSGCWLWIGALVPAGYGQLQFGAVVQYAHRLSYDCLVGPIPNGLHIDHLCRTRCCVNPEHLEPVSSRVNVLRGDGPTAKNAEKTRCLNGHPLSGDNLRLKRNGGERVCRTCRNARARKAAP